MLVLSNYSNNGHKTDSNPQQPVSDSPPAIEQITDVGKELYVVGNDFVEKAKNTESEELRFSYYQIAYYCYVRAAEKKYIPALYELGYLYEMGLGVDKNLDYAIELYSVAVELGYEPAKGRLKELADYENTAGTR